MLTAKVEEEEEEDGEEEQQQQQQLKQVRKTEAGVLSASEVTESSEKRNGGMRSEDADDGHGQNRLAVLSH